MKTEFIDYDGMCNIERTVESKEQANTVRILTDEGNWMADISLETYDAETWYDFFGRVEEEFKLT